MTSDILPAPNGVPLWRGLPRITPKIFLLHGSPQATFLHRQFHDLSDRYKTALFYDYSRSNISVCCISARFTMMHSYIQFFLPGMHETIGACLACPARVDTGVVDTPLPAYPVEDIQESTPPSIKAMLSQHSPTKCSEIQVLSKDHSNSITELVSGQEVKLPTGCSLSRLRFQILKHMESSFPAIHPDSGWGHHRAGIPRSQAKFLIRPDFVANKTIYSWAAYIRPDLSNPVVTGIVRDANGWAWNCWNGYKGKTRQEVAYKLWSSTNAEHVGVNAAEQARIREVKDQQEAAQNTRTNGTAGSVYLVQAQGTNLYKIGRSASPQNRIRCLETHSPYKLVLLHETYSADSVHAERSLHQRFAAYRVHGEWFELPQEAVNYICSLEVL